MLLHLHPRQFFPLPLLLTTIIIILGNLNHHLVVAIHPQPQLQPRQTGSPCPKPCGLLAQYCCSDTQVCVTSANIPYCIVAPVSTTSTTPTPIPTPAPTPTPTDPVYTIQTETSLRASPRPSDPVYTIQTNTVLTSSTRPTTCQVPCGQYCCGANEVCGVVAGVTSCGVGIGTSSLVSVSSVALTTVGNLSTTASGSGSSVRTSGPSASPSPSSTIIQPATGLATSPHTNDRLVIGMLTLLAAVLMAAVL